MPENSLHNAKDVQKQILVIVLKVPKTNTREFTHNAEGVQEQNTKEFIIVPKDKCQRIHYTTPKCSSITENSLQCQKCQKTNAKEFTSNAESVQEQIPENSLYEIIGVVLLVDFLSSLFGVDDGVIMSTSQVQSEETSQCIFADLVEKYNIANSLKHCDINPKRIQNANALAVVRRLVLLQPYMPEHANYHSSLATYIICQKHYNQIVVNDYYNLASLNQEENQPDTNQDNIAISYTHQDNVTMSYNNLIIKLNRAKELLEVFQIEN
ncbi:8365_t:CDS:2 [Gigaspora margarita]|uniref:8365_t:CDS:1 n=1 Tax=Gigaspora margarita TaxID=4874 RepID=A0ABN7VED7_GIGMA|nr:8365_t:CDS:2 [Gigaspora margarita]